MAGRVPLSPDLRKAAAGCWAGKGLGVGFLYRLTRVSCEEQRKTTDGRRSFKGLPKKNRAGETWIETANYGVVCGK